MIEKEKMYDTLKTEYIKHTSILKQKAQNRK